MYFTSIVKFSIMLIYRGFFIQVAKESADVIILDDNFSTIVTVAKWGRSIYTNIQKFVQFQLTVNLVALLLNFSSACLTGTIMNLLTMLIPLGVALQHVQRKKVVC